MTEEVIAALFAPIMIILGLTIMPTSFLAKDRIYMVKYKVVYYIQK